MCGCGEDCACGPNRIRLHKNVLLRYEDAVWTGTGNNVVNQFAIPLPIAIENYTRCSLCSLAVTDAWTTYSSDIGFSQLE